MARRNTKYDPYGQPGLFDELDESIRQRMVFSVLGEDKVRLSGGSVPVTAESENPLGPIVVKPVPNKIVFMSFGSGSSGNCAYIGDSTGGFLIDAGVDVKKVVEGLKAHGISMDQVKGICLTHDHSDHMRFAYGIVRKYRHIGVYCTLRVLGGLLRRHSVSRRIKDYHVSIYKEIPFTIGNFTITAFEVMHDGTDNAGFYVQHDDRAFGIATDLGCISERADYYLRQADYLMLESNYDLAMLKEGAYPEYLKARIQTDCGHLDNTVTAEYLAKIYSPRLKNIFLCHLSQDNNTPEIALSTTKKALQRLGLKIGAGENTPEDNACDVQLVVLPRFDCSSLYTFRAI